MIYTYSGDISVTIRVTNSKDVQNVKDILSEEGFSTSWLNVVVDNATQIKAELDNATEIKNIINDQVKVYEEILGYDLGKITSLSLYAWADGNTLTENGEVTLQISANVSYSPTIEQ
jgi:hypothetical protein